MTLEKVAEEARHGGKGVCVGVFGSHILADLKVLVAPCAAHPVFAQDILQTLLHRFSVHVFDPSRWRQLANTHTTKLHALC